MIIGKLNQRITIQVGTLTNTNGQPTWVYSTYATRWANITDSGGNETRETDERVAINYIDIIVRAENITPNETMLIQWKGMTWNITSVSPFELTAGKQKGWFIKAKSKDNG